jgi:hypothetical protein
MSSRPFMGGNGGNSSKKKRKTPQDTISKFWSKFVDRSPSRVTSIFPPSLYANLLRDEVTQNEKSSCNAAESYGRAARECKEQVARIVRECHRTNEKFVDREFDLEGDFGRWNCLKGLLASSGSDGVNEDVEGDGSAPSGLNIDSDDLRLGLSVLLASGVLGSSVTSAPINLLSLQNILSAPPAKREMLPQAVHRVDWIYQDPKFIVDGFSDLDVQQGANGDCWWLAAVATLCSVEGVMDRVCIARDEECGVYGFVFFRDGEWTWTVVDDNLYLNCPDYDSGGYDGRGERERRHKDRNQTGSEALYFARSSDENETWLPLLEKAYAKIHGDYEAIEGGLMGEGVEDMTGGVTATLVTNRILRKERLWNELLNEKKEFLFALGCAGSSDSDSKNGLAMSHAYSVIDAIEAKGPDGKTVRLVKIR